MDRWVFAEPTVGVNTYSGSFVSQAKLNGCIVFSNWKRLEVEKLLPPGLKLGTNTSPNPDLHPVAFIFGDLVDGATIFGGVTFHTGIAYQEFALAIPFVKHASSAYLHTYIPRMYSSYFPPTWSGNTHYGFGKQMAAMGWQGPVFVITSEDGTPLLHAAVETEAIWQRGGACDLPNFRSMQTVFSLPIVGRKTDGRCVCSYFRWDFSEALVRPADALISIDAPLVEGITCRRRRDVPSWTFEVRGMVWQLSWPSPRGIC